MVELDHQRSTAKASDNKMTEIRYICEQLTYLIVAGLRHNLSLHFTVLIHCDEY